MLTLLLSFKAVKSEEESRLYKQYELVKEKEKVYFDSQSRVRNIRIEDFSTISLSRISLGEIRDSKQILQQIKSNRRFLNALTSNFTKNIGNTYSETVQIAHEFENNLQEYLR